MSTVEDIKGAIQHLSPREQARLADWVLERVEKDWDCQIAADIKAGRLDAVIKEVDRDARAGDLGETP